MPVIDDDDEDNIENYRFRDRSDSLDEDPEDADLDRYDAKMALRALRGRKSSRSTDVPEVQAILDRRRSSGAAAALDFLDGNVFLVFMSVALVVRLMGLFLRR